MTNEIMNKIVISLKSSQDRRLHIKNEFGKNGVDFFFFDAIEPQQNAKIIADYNLKIDHNKLTNGEISCLLSHFEVWNYIKKRNLEFCAIFEDDIIIGSDFSEVLSNTDWIPDKSIVKLGTMNTDCILSKRKRLIPGDRYIHNIYNLHYGSEGYILSKSTATLLIKYFKNIEISKPIDNILFNPKEKILHGDYLIQMNPAIVIQDKILNPNQQKFSSLIDSDRTHNRKHLKNKIINTNIKTKVIREGKRIIKDVKNIFSISFVNHFLFKIKYKKDKVNFK